ncbi:hypothetical protein FS749_015576 [Ceratobasidium sp. UAMH 11750]|nr:hypothetical protein FS749_015576 [Ceratobasidium sp. UAMH 11750]
MSPYGSTPLEAERDRIRAATESGERVSTPTSTLVPVPHLKGSTPGPPSYPLRRSTQQLPPQIQTSSAHPLIQTH